jgi:hypothetical protein
VTSHHLDQEFILDFKNNISCCDLHLDGNKIPNKVIEVLTQESKRNFGIMSLIVPKYKEHILEMRVADQEEKYLNDLGDEGEVEPDDMVINPVSGVSLKEKEENDKQKRTMNMLKSYKGESPTFKQGEG